MSTIAILGGAIISVAALGWLATTDPKRRRAFGMPVYPGARHARAAWIAAVLPGLALPFIGGGAAFVLWFGGVSIVAWALVALPPGRGQSLLARLDRWRLAVSGGLSRLSRPPRAITARLAAALTLAPGRRSRPAPIRDDARITALERRVRLLEAELARLGHAPHLLAEDRPPPRVSAHQA